MNIEEQKAQIKRILEGVRLGGIEAAIRFNEEAENEKCENGRIEAIFEGVERPMIPIDISFAVQEQTAEEAVIADILSKFVNPDEVNSSTTTTVIEVANSTDSFLCAFRDWGYHVLTQSSYDSSPQMTQVTPSTRVMDRLTAVYINWRVKNYAPGEEDDHPF